MKPPKWTVWAHKQDGDYVASCCFFYQLEAQADDRARQLQGDGWVTVRRPWDRELDLPRMAPIDRRDLGSK